MLVINQGQGESPAPIKMEDKEMRLIHYYVINKITGESVNVRCFRSKAEAIIAEKADPENWAIGYKWVSI